MASEYDFSDFEENETGLGKEEITSEEEMDFSDFDQPAEIKSEEPTDRSFDIPAAVSGLAEGVSLGFDDEILGGVNVLKKLLDSNKNYKENYEAGRDARRAQQKELRERSPVSTLVGEIPGAMITPGGGAKLLGRGVLKSGSLLKGLANIGAQAAGTSEDSNIADIAQQGGITAALSAAIEGILPAGKALHRAAGEPLDDLFKAYQASKAGSSIFGEQARRGAEEQVQSVSKDIAESLNKQGKNLASQKRSVLDQATNTTDIQMPFKQAWDDIQMARSLDTRGIANDRRKISDLLLELGKQNDNQITNLDPRNVNKLTQQLQRLSEKAGINSEPFVKTDEARNILSNFEKSVRDANVQNVPGLGDANKKIAEYNRLLEGLGIEKVQSPYDFDPKAVTQVDNKLQTMLRGLERDTEQGIRARQSFEKLSTTLPQDQVGRAKEASNIFDLTKKAQSDNLFSKSTLATGALVGNMDRVLNAPSNYVASLAQEAQVKGHPGLADGLTKLATEKSERAKKAILFSLQQNPAYRQFFKDNNLEDKE